MGFHASRMHKDKDTYWDENCDFGTFVLGGHLRTLSKNGNFPAPKTQENDGVFQPPQHLKFFMGGC